MKRALIVFAALLTLLAVALPAGAQTGGPDYDLPGGGHFYTQTNGGAGAQLGFRITDEGGMRFWSEFQRLGGVNVLGYPSSRRFQLDGFTVQATQKVLLQWRPEANQVYFVNVFDKLHDLGLDGTLQSTYQIPLQLDPSFDAGKTPDQVQAARMALLNEDAAIAGRYNNPGGALSLLYYGLPTSHATNEGPFSAMRAQRIAIQHWSQANAAAGIKAGDVTVVNGGDIAKQLGVVPASAATTETAAGQPAVTPTPVATPTATLPPYTYKSKAVTTPPTDCSSDPTVSAVPCQTVAPNVGAQYIKGRVMDAKGNHQQFVNVQAIVAGNTLQTQTAGDGTFTFLIAGGASPTGPCPNYTLTYQIMVLSATGGQDSDVYTVNYDGNCSVDGEFHFDFIKVR